MTEVAIVLVLVFVALLLSNVPIGVAIGTASLAAVFANGGMASSETIVADRMVNGVSSFSLLAIPFFVLSGILMGLSVVEILAGIGIVGKKLLKQ